MRELILVMGGEGILPQLEKALAPLRVGIKSIPDKHFTHSIGYLAGDKSCPRAQNTYAGAPLERPLLLLAGFSSQRLDRVLRTLQGTGLELPYKAVLTESNRRWDVPTLYREIAEEHRQMTGEC